MSGVVQREWRNAEVKSCCRPVAQPSPGLGIYAARLLPAGPFSASCSTCQGVCWNRPRSLVETFGSWHACLWGAGADTSEDGLHMLGGRLSRGGESKLILGHAGEYRCGCHVTSLVARAACLPVCCSW